MARIKRIVIPNTLHHLLIILLMTIKGYAIFNIEEFNKNSNEMGYYKSINNEGKKTIKMTFDFALHHVINNGLSYVEHIRDDFSFYHTEEKFILFELNQEESAYIEIIFDKKNESNFESYKYSKDGKLIAYSKNYSNHKIEITSYDLNSEEVLNSEFKTYYNVIDIRNYLKINKNFFLWDYSMLEDIKSIGMTKNNYNMYEKYKNEILDMFKLIEKKYKFIPISEEYNIHIEELNNGTEFKITWVNEVVINAKYLYKNYSLSILNNKINLTSKLEDRTNDSY